MTFQLSEKAQQLIPKARIVSFATWEGSVSDSAIQLFQAADDEGRYLTDADLQSAPASPVSVEAARLLRDRADEIVSEARSQVLEEYPRIIHEGGSLYPPARAEACWRDFWHFLRCISYGIAGGTTEFTSTEGLQYMELLYQELRVPLEAMVLGLEHLKYASLRRLQPEAKQKAAPYFDHLLSQMHRFGSAQSA